MKLKFETDPIEPNPLLNCGVDRKVLDNLARILKGTHPGFIISDEESNPAGIKEWSERFFGKSDSAKAKPIIDALPDFFKVVERSRKIVGYSASNQISEKISFVNRTKFLKYYDLLPK